MRIFVLIFLLFFLTSIIAAQEKKKEIEGTVSYITSQNIYVKFLSARGVKSGDNIFFRENDLLVPVIVVENTSSISCVGKSIGTKKLKIGDKVIALILKDNTNIEQQVPTVQSTIHYQDTVKNAAGNSLSQAPSRKERIDGRVQIASYNSLSSLSMGNATRMRYTWSMNASNIGNSRISFDSYISFSHQLNNWAPIQSNIFNGLKIYDLNVRYEAGNNATIWLGRKINPKIANLGAVDGLQVEMDYKHFYWGAVAGFRPDYTDYSFNKNLLEYGAFIGHTTKNENGVMQTSFGGFNQTNSGNTDRRFIYIQHDNSLLKNLSLFASSEIDLYKVINGIPVNEVSLTSLYLMLNFRISRKLSISTSYDNRKNIIYYETYKSYVDMMLADATRQGVSLRINYRPMPYVILGMTTSYWDRAGDTQPTENINGNLTYTQLPFLKAAASLTVNAIQTSYVKGMIYGLRLDKDFVKGKMNWGISYRYVDYTYLNTSGKLLEHIASTDLSYQFTRKFSISFNCEGTFDPQNIYQQIYVSLIKRF